jgi:hypothetical protein
MPVERAAQKIVKALRRKKKVYNFPWQTTLMMRATRWAPDWLMRWIVGGYASDRPHHTA